MMKVVVKTNLNVRVGTPSVNAPCYQYLAIGSELLIDGQIYKGDLYKGIDKWYKDEAGNYYWGGGVMIKNGSFGVEQWFKQLGIEKIWNDYQEQGERAHVLMLDTGINEIPNVLRLDSASERVNFTDVPENEKIQDQTGHGTHCAGLIIGEKEGHVIGVAPKSKLSVGKISKRGFFMNDDKLREALRYFQDNDDIDIVSLSIGLRKNRVNKLDLYGIIDHYVKKGCLVIAAIGNDPEDNNLTISTYPAYFDNCISVGACELDHKIASYSLSPLKPTIYCYGTQIGSFKSTNIITTETGTSQATAIVAGICCLLISYLKKKNIKYNQNSIIELMKRSSNPMRDSKSYQADRQKYKAKIIDPIKLFQILNNLIETYENGNIDHLQDLLDKDDQILFASTNFERFL